MTADAASPDTPPDPREVAIRRAMDVAKAATKEAASRGAGGFYILGIAIPALADAGLLSLSGDSTRGRGTVDPDVLAVLEYVSAGRRHVDSTPYPDGKARRALGRIRDEGSLRSEASGTPASYIPFNGNSDHLFSRLEDVQSFIDEMGEPGDDWRIYEARLRPGTPAETGEVPRP